MPTKKKMTTPPVDNLSGAVDKLEESAIEKAPIEPPATAMPTDAHTYYVWNERGQFLKFFTNEVYKGEALKFAREFASSVGGTVSC